MFRLYSAEQKEIVFCVIDKKKKKKGYEKTKNNVLAGRPMVSIHLNKKTKTS